MRYHTSVFGDKFNRMLGTRCTCPGMGFLVLKKTGENEDIPPNPLVLNCDRCQKTYPLDK